MSALPVRGEAQEPVGARAPDRAICAGRSRRNDRESHDESGEEREACVASYNDRQPVRHRPPPAALLRVLNPTVRASLGTPLWRLFPSWMAVLEFSGRRSHRPLRVPVGLHDVRGTPTVFTERPWRLNFAGGAPVTVISRGKRRHGRGELVQDRGEVGSALAVALERTRPSNLGLAVEKGHQPTAQELAALGGDIITIRYDGR